ncbi:MAG: Hsp20/alpha crystallin family protein [Bacteroidia bacterium]|nr:Hsp20/alpha crystallin family protein [Bacteroidia bacterium]
MTLVKRQATPSRLFPGFPAVFDELFYPEWSNTSFNTPAVNIHEDNNGFTLEVAAPGLTKENFKLELNHRSLKISASRESQAEEQDEKGRYTRREFNYAAFSRSFTLPETIDTAQISAAYENGVLLVKLPKRTEARTQAPRIVEIN